MLAELEMTSEGGAYGAIPLITDTSRNTLFSVDQCRAAHAERDSKPKVRRGTSATRQDPDNGKKFLGYHILEPEERPRGGRELYRMEEDEGLPEVAVVLGDDESMMVDEQVAEEVGYEEYGAGDVMYERSGDDVGYEHGGTLAEYNDYDMEMRPRYNTGYRRRGPPTRPPEFFKTLPTLAPSSRGLHGASGAYRTTTPALVPRGPAGVASGMPDGRPRSHEPRQPSNGANRAPSFPREIQRMDQPRIRSLSRDVPRMHQGIPATQARGQAPGEAARSFMRLAQSLRQEKEEGVTYYRREGASGPSSDAYSMAQEAKANRRRYGS